MDISFLSLSLVFSCLFTILLYLLDVNAHFPFSIPTLYFFFFSLLFLYPMESNSTQSVWSGGC